MALHEGLSSTGSTQIQMAERKTKKNGKIKKRRFKKKAEDNTNEDTEDCGSRPPKQNNENNTISNINNTKKIYKTGRTYKFVSKWNNKWVSTVLIVNRMEPSTSKSSVTRQSLKRSVFALELVQLPRRELSFLLTMKNVSAVVVVLRSTHLVNVNTKLLAIFPEGEIIRMCPAYSWEEEFTLTQPFLDIENIELLITATALIQDNCKLVIHERYKFIKTTERKEGTKLILPKLPMFEIPKMINTLYNNNFKNRGAFGSQETELLARVEKSKERFIQSSGIYREQLTLLNQIEDEHMRRQFFSYTIDNPKIEDKKINRIYSLSINQFKQRPSMLKEDIEVRVLVEGKTRNKFFTGFIERMEHDTVIITMKKNISVNNVLRIQFIAQRTSLRLEYRALELLDNTVIGKLFFPENIEAEVDLDKISDFQWFSESVPSNEEQMTAIKNIVNRTSYPAPYILFGPPGTGKTTTLVEAMCQIYELRPQSNMLLAVSSNSAANEIVDRLLTFIPSDDIFRFFAKSFERKMSETDMNVLRASNLSRGSYSVPHYEEIYLSRIVVCTLTTAGRLSQANISEKHFDYILVDECGSAKEVSVLVAIAGIGAKDKNINALVVLAGDPNQLGPVIQYDFLKDTSQSISMLERMMNHEFYRRDSFGRYNSTVITQLRDNYRSHEALLRFSNSMFYDNQLRAKVSEEVANFALDWPFLPNRSFPIIFHPINGQIITDSSSTSMYNQEEAKQIMYYIQVMLKKGVNGKRVKQSDIGVLSPYARQVNLLRNLCDERGWQQIEIGSTEQYQGREKLIMLISTVRSQCFSVGFLANVKRLNVALTRARALMIIVGNQATLQRNKHWKAFIAYCEENKAIVPNKTKKKYLSSHRKKDFEKEVNVNLKYFETQQNYKFLRFGSFLGKR